MSYGRKQTSKIYGSQMSIAEIAKKAKVPVDVVFAALDGNLPPMEIARIAKVCETSDYKPHKLSACWRCNKPIGTDRVRYCSTQCATMQYKADAKAKRDYENEQKPARVFDCQECGTKTSSPRRRFCSQKCGGRHYARAMRVRNQQADRSESG